MDSQYPTQGDPVETGSARIIAFAKLPSGRQPGEEFFERLPVRTYRRFRAALRFMADRCRPPGGINYFKVEGSDKIHAFQIEKWWLLAFTDKDKLVLLCGGDEVTGRLPRRIVERAEEIRNDYFTGQKVTTLPVRKRA